MLSVCSLCGKHAISVWRIWTLSRGIEIPLLYHLNQAHVNFFINIVGGYGFTLLPVGWVLDWIASSWKMQRNIKPTFFPFTMWFERCILYSHILFTYIELHKYYVLCIFMMFHISLLGLSRWQYKFIFLVMLHYKKNIAYSSSRC